MDGFESDPRSAGRNVGRRHLLGGLVAGAGATLAGCMELIEEGGNDDEDDNDGGETQTTSRMTLTARADTISRRYSVSPGCQSRCGRSVG